MELLSGVMAMGAMAEAFAEAKTCTGYKPRTCHSLDVLQRLVDVQNIRLLG